MNKRNYEPIFNVLFACNSGSGGCKGRAPPFNANSFMFMQFLANLLQNSRLPPPVSWKSWIPPLQWVELVTFSDLKKFSASMRNQTSVSCIIGKHHTIRPLRHMTTVIFTLTWSKYVLVHFSSSDITLVIKCNSWLKKWQFCASTGNWTPLSRITGEHHTGRPSRRLTAVTVTDHGATYCENNQSVLQCLYAIAITWMKQLGCHTGHQEISRCRTKSESEESIACRQQST